MNDLPIEACLKFKEGLISREDLIDYLANYHYVAPVVEGQDEWGVDMYSYPEGSFNEVMQAVLYDYIPFDLYEELFDVMTGRKDKPSDA